MRHVHAQTGPRLCVSVFVYACMCGSERLRGKQFALAVRAHTVNQRLRRSLSYSLSVISHRSFLFTIPRLPLAFPIHRCVTAMRRFQAMPHSLQLAN